MTYFEKLKSTHRKSEDKSAFLSSSYLDIRKQNIKESMCGLGTLSHRQQYIGNIGGVMYYDDSKAESVNATWFTFENIINPVIWIAGGDAKDVDFSDLLPMARKNVKALICIGNDNENLLETFNDSINEIFEAHSIEEAVHFANLMAQEDDIVLFSPACKPDKTKENYTELGNQFVESVKRIQDEHHQ